MAGVESKEAQHERVTLTHNDDHHHNRSKGYIQLLLY